MTASGRTIPARRRRGLTLFETLLAVSILSAMVSFGAQWSAAWMDRRVAGGEAQAVAELARAGRLWLEADISGRQPPAGGTISVSFAALEAAGLWSEAQARTTPFSRRSMDLTLFAAGGDRIMVIARAPDDTGMACQSSSGVATGVPRSLLSVEDRVSTVGVVAEFGGTRRLIGPQVNLDVASGLPASLTVGCGDVLALAHVYGGVACEAYLHRASVAGCADANRLDTDLDLGGQALVGVNVLTADVASLGALAGSVIVNGDTTVSGDLIASGAVALDDLSAAGSVDVAGNGAILGNVDVAGSVGIAGSLAGEDLSFDGILSVAGEARLTDFTAGSGYIDHVTTGTVESGDARFWEMLVVDTLFGSDHTTSAALGGP